MQLKDVLDKLVMEPLVLCDADVTVTGGYSSDLLSDVMANSVEGQIWVTLQGHQNIVAIASLKDLAAVVITGGYPADELTLNKAQERGVNIFTTPQNNYQFSGELYKLMGK